MTHESHEREPNAADEKSLIQVAFPDKAGLVFVAALIVGAVLICLPTAFRSYFAVNGTQANLVLCSGLAIVLAAFGGQATMRIGRFIMAGAAAIAIGLFYYLDSRREFLEGKLSFYDYGKYKSIEIKNRNHIIGMPDINASNEKRSEYEFIIIKDQLQDSRIEVRLIKRDDRKEEEKGAGKEKEEVLYVDVGEIEWAFGARRRLEWQLRERKANGQTALALYEVFRDKFVSEEIKIAAVQPPRRRITRGFVRPFISRAEAQQPLIIADANVLLRKLKSDDTALRRGARKELAKVSPDEIPTIMKAFHDEFGIYRVRLGVVVALSEMLRNNERNKKEISDRLTDKDLNLLLDAAADRDKTVRIYATKFLIDLADARATKMAVRRAADPPNDAARYNWLLTAQNGWNKLSVRDRRELAPVIQQIDQQSDRRTKRLVDKLK